jgi:hypothetical protein
MDMLTKIDTKELIRAPKGLSLILDEKFSGLHEAGPVPSPILCQGAISYQRDEG